MSQQQQRSIYLLAFTCSVFVLRMALPFTLYFLITGILLTAVYSFQSIVETLRSFSVKRYQLFIPFIFTILFFIYPFAFTHPMEMVVIKESLNLVLVVVILFLVMSIIKDEPTLSNFISVFAKIFVSIVLFVSILAGIKFWLILKGVQLSFLLHDEKYPYGTSLSFDYNFYTVAIYLAFLLMLWFRFDIFPKKWKALNHIGFALITVNIFYTGSRRGLIILSVLLSIQFIISLLQIKQFKLNKEKILIPMVGVAVFISQIYFLFFSSYDVRMYAGKAIGVYGKPYKKEVTAIAFRYLTLINPTAHYKEMFHTMWPKAENEGNQISTPDLPYEKTTYGSRTERWKYGFSIFSNEYSWPQKIFGNGFQYLKKFAVRFKVIQYNPYDYPHSPFISALLYSGVMGLLVILVYFGCSAYYILTNKLYHPVFICFYGIVGFFSILSGNSYFSIPIFVALTLVPYFMAFLRMNVFVKIDRP